MRNSFLTAWIVAFLLTGFGVHAQDAESRAANVFLSIRDAQGGETLAQLEPTFSPGVFEYSAIAPADTSAILGTVELGHPAQAVQVNGVPVPQAPIAVDFEVETSSPTTLVIKVTAENGVAESIYSFSIARPPGPESDLADLAISEGSLSPGFHPEVRAYSVTVPKEVAQVSLTATHSDQAGSIRINGAIASSGVLFGGVELPLVAPGLNQVRIESISADGLTVSPYSVSIERRQGTNASLARLQVLPDQEFTFGPGTDSISTTVPHSTSAIDIRVVPEDPDASVFRRVDGNTEVEIGASAIDTIALPVGLSTITLRIVSEDETAMRIYTLQVRRMIDPSAALQRVWSTARVCCSTEYPSTPEQLVFPFVAASDQRFIDVTVSAADPGATLRLAGLSIQQAAASRIALPVPHPSQNPLRVPLEVTSADGAVTVTYQITVARDPSNDNTLSVMAPNQGVLLPAFDPQVDFYQMAVPVGTPLSFAVTATDPAAFVEVYGFAGALSGPVVTGQPTASIPVPEGVSFVTFSVTAETGDKREYVLQISGGLSSQNRLSSVFVTRGLLWPRFEPSINNYDLWIPDDVESVQFFASAMSVFASVLVNGEPLSAEGESVPVPIAAGAPIQIRVTAQSGAERTYAITPRVQTGDYTDAQVTVLTTGQVGDTRGYLVGIRAEGKPEGGGYFIELTGLRGIAFSEWECAGGSAFSDCMVWPTPGGATAQAILEAGGIVRLRGSAQLEVGAPFSTLRATANWSGPVPLRRLEDDRYDRTDANSPSGVWWSGFE